MSDTNVTPTPDTSDSPQGSPPATPQGDNGGKPEPTFSQAEMNKIAAQRAREAQERERKKLLEDTGLDSMDSLMSLIADAKKRKESELSELEKAQAQIDAANKKAAEAEQRVKEMEARILTDARRATFESAVTASGGTDVKRLYVLVQAEKATEFNGLFGDDATPDKAQMEKFIKQVQADFPNYFGTPGAGSPSNASGVAPTSADFSDEAAANWERRLRKN